MKAWYFISEDKRLRYGDDNTVAPGYVYKVDGDIALCKWGLHASKRAIDALHYAPGPIVCRVALGGTIINGDDKSVATSRKVLWMADAKNALHEFACQVAEQALENAGVKDERFWNAIKAKRAWVLGEINFHELAAAREAAGGEAWDLAWDAARAAAWEAAGGAAWDAARAAAWEAARAAARGAARGAARADQDKRLTRMLMDLNKDNKS